ncbi:MAG: hypothetical protein U0704_05665 [Candidatus Eisenbacteria bacterium]
MTWSDIKASVRADLLGRGLANPNIRLNALRRVEEMLPKCYPGFPNELAEIAKSGRKALASKLASLKATGKLNASEQSVLKMVFDRLDGSAPIEATPDPVAEAPVAQPKQHVAARLTIEDLSNLRRQLIGHVVKLEVAAGLTSGDGIGARIGRLAREEVIPRDIAACMRVVTEVRNKAEYEARNPSPALAVAVLAAWAAIEEWLKTR